MDRPTYDEEGNYIYYASELGSCTKYLIGKRMGYEDKTRGGDDQGPLPLLFEEGHLHEEAVIGKLRSDGWTITGQQEVVKLSVGVAGTVIIGHLDGTGGSNSGSYYSSGGVRVVEVKSSGQDQFQVIKKHGFDAPGLMQKYKWQISVYMFAKEMPGLFVFKNRNTGELLLLPVDEPFYNYDELQLRIYEIDTAAETGNLPKTCDVNMFPCGLDYLHEEEKVIRKDSEIDTWAEEYNKAGEEIERCKEVRREARGKIEAALGDLTKLETINGTRIVRYPIRQRDSTGINVAKVEEWLGELDDESWAKALRLQWSDHNKGEGESNSYGLRITRREL